MPPSTKEILEKYSKKLSAEITPDEEKDFSRDYSKFRKEMSPPLSKYEKWAKSLGNLIKIRVKGKDKQAVQELLDTAHLDVTAEEAVTLSIISMLGIFFITVAIGVAVYLLTNSPPTLLIFLGVLASMFSFYYTYNLPKRFASLWKLQASSQMVPAILYTVIYMKHTSNLERAVHFTSEHLEGPLALDFKKIFYDVEIGKFSTIKQSLDSYLEFWREYAPEFIESFHLIESSLFEPSEARRVQILEKSLQVILDGVHEKMLKYTREIRSPLTNIYMLGIMLPTLGLALLPLASTLLGGIMQWYHVFVLFNLIIPLLVSYIITDALLKPPGAYA